MSLATTLRCGVKANKVGPADSGVSALALQFASDVQLGNGTAASKADLIFTDERIIAASGSEDLDLAGTLADVFGQTLTFVKIKAILIEANAANTNNVVFGPASANGFTGPFADASDRISLPAGGRAMFMAPVNGWAVTASTGDLLNVANSGGGTGITYKVTLIGTSA